MMLAALLPGLLAAPAPGALPLGAMNDGVREAMQSFLGLREGWAALTHIIGAVISLVGCRILWRRSEGDRPKQISMLIYGGSLVLLYMASALYHLVHAPADQLDHVYRRLDHCAIFILIAGTYTPFCFNAVGGAWRLGSLLVVWGCALAGIALKAIFIEMGDGPSAAIYVIMGWLCVFGYAKLAAAITHRAMAWLGLGGIIYSVGATIDVYSWPVPQPGVFGAHEIFHVLVMIASAVQFAVVLRYVVPFERPRFAPWVRRDDHRREARISGERPGPRAHDAHEGKRAQR